MKPFMHILRYTAICLLALDVTAAFAHAQRLTSGTASASPAKENPLEPALIRARDSLTHIQANVRDYTAVFVKRHRVNGKLTEQTWANMKVRNRRMRNERIEVPMSVYLEFLKPTSVKGREVIWVEGQNDGKLIAHEAGIRNLMNVKLDPKGTLAMRDERYPITEIGMENLAMKLVDAAKTEEVHAGCEVRVSKNAKIGDHACDMYEVTYPKRQPDVDFYRTRVFFSREPEHAHSLRLLVLARQIGRQARFGRRIHLPECKGKRRAARSGF